MGTFLANSRTFLNIVFLWRLKETPSDIMRRAMAIVRRVLLEVIYFWELSSIPKISEPFDTFLELLPVVIFYANLTDDISDTSMWFDEVIVLELRCMLDSMAEDDLLCKFEMDALTFSEYSWRTPFRTCLYFWSSRYLFIWNFSLGT